MHTSYFLSLFVVIQVKILSTQLMVTRVRGGFFVVFYFQKQSDWGQQILLTSCSCGLTLDLYGEKKMIDSMRYSNLFTVIILSFILLAICYPFEMKSMTILILTAHVFSDNP